MTDRLRIGVIGCGNIASRLHVPTWIKMSDRVEVVAIADPTAVNLEAVRGLTGLDTADAYTDPFALLARDDLDAIDICAPQSFHRDLVVAAAARRRHVICEKPLAAVPADAEVAVQACANHDVRLAMVHNFLGFPEVTTMRRQIDAGAIGQVRNVHINLLGVFDAPGSDGYDARWRHNPVVSGGGILMDLLHGVYTAEHLLGEPIERVTALIDAQDPAALVEDTALCRFDTATRSATVNIAWGFGPGSMEVVGTAGRVSVRYRDGSTPPWSPLEHVAVTDAQGTRVVYHATPNPDGLFDNASLSVAFPMLADDFLAAIRDHRDPIASGATGLRILEATIGAYQSAVTGEMITVPLDRTSPAFRKGVFGLRELDLPPWSPLRRTAIFTNPG